MNRQRLIEGGEFADNRGMLRFFNDFDMSEVVRFYEIYPICANEKRGWQAHKKEKKWFYCLSGSFDVYYIQIDDFEEPSNHSSPVKQVLKENTPVVLAVPEGYATAIVAIENSSRLQVFSNFTVEQSKEDDFRYAINHWNINWN